MPKSGCRLPETKRVDEVISVTYLRINPVLALLLLLTVIAALPFISYAPNRLVSGEGRHLWQLWPQTIWMLVGVGCAWLTACFIPVKKAAFLHSVLAQFVFVLRMVWRMAGKAATQLAQNGSALARTSLGSGFWLAAALALLACSDAIRRISTHPLWRWLLHMQIAIIPLWLLYSGTLNDLSLMKEYANRQDVFDDALAQHLTLLFGAVLPALVIGVPLGIWCYFSTARQGAIFSLLNVIQTVPSVALFGLLIERRKPKARRMTLSREIAPAEQCRVTAHAGSTAQQQRQCASVVVHIPMVGVFFISEIVSCLRLAATAALAVLPHHRAKNVPPRSAAVFFTRDRQRS